MKKSCLIMAPMLSAVVLAGALFAHAQEGSPRMMFYGVDGTNVVADTGPKAKPAVVGTAAGKDTTVTKVQPPPAPKPEKDRWLALKVAVQLVEGEGKHEKVTAVPMSRVFRSGDRVRLKIESNKKGYLYVANIGSSERYSILYPRKGAAQPVESYASCVVPQGKAAFRFDDQPGEEKVLVVLSSAQLRGWDEIGTPAGAPSGEATSPVQLAATGRDRDLKLEDDPGENGIEPASYATNNSVSHKNNGDEPIVVMFALKHE